MTHFVTHLGFNRYIAAGPFYILLNNRNSGPRGNYEDNFVMFERPLDPDYTTHGIYIDLL